MDSMHCVESFLTIFPQRPLAQKKYYDQGYS